MAGGGVYVRVRAYRREEKRVGGGGMEKAEKRFIPRARARTDVGRQWDCALTTKRRTTTKTMMMTEHRQHESASFIRVHN